MPLLTLPGFSSFFFSPPIVRILHNPYTRVFEILRTEGGRFSAGLTEASYLAVLLSAKHFFVVLYAIDYWGDDAHGD